MQPNYPHPPSTLSEHIEPFHVMELVKQADELSAQGKNVLHLSIGEPDFPMPAPVCAAFIHAIETHKTRYTSALGLIQLRAKISEFYLKQFNVEIDPQQVIITSGASCALMYACLTLINPHDKVLLTDPGYPCNKTFIEMAGGQAVCIPVTEQQHFQPQKTDIQTHWDKQTEGVLLASPSNPTGTRIPSKDLHEIIEFVSLRNGFIVMDEIYQLLSYGSPARSVLQLPSALLQQLPVIVVNSFSKYFGMTGLRLGWMIAPLEFITPIEKLAQNLNICPSTPAQWAALKCFEPETLSICEQRRGEFEKRRNYLMNALPEAGLKPLSDPDGAFYIYAESPYDSDQYCHDLLQQAHVCVVPGKDFSKKNGKNRIRLSYANSLENLQEAIQRIKRFNYSQV